MSTTSTVFLTAPQKSGEPKRALVLPGGGLRLSYQAGILVALQEAGIAFQFMDGTSGGSLNLSMLLSGLSPNEICQRWRTLRLIDTISFLPLEDYLKVENLQGLGDTDAFRHKVLPHFGIDAPTRFRHGRAADAHARALLRPPRRGLTRLVRIFGPALLARPRHRQRPASQ